MGGTGTNQHTVPQTYLKHFAKDNHVAVYNKGCSVFLKKTRSVKSCASNNGFYDAIDANGKQTDIVDRALDAGLDSASTLLKKVDEFCSDAKNHESLAVLCPEEKEELACYITMQLLRDSVI